MRAHLGRMTVHLDAAAWRKTWGERYLLFLSVGGPREAVRAVLSGAALGKEILLEGEEGLVRVKPSYGRSRTMTARVKGGYHGIWTLEDLGEKFYIARGENEEQEVLWASRALGLPIPIPWWPNIREALLLPSLGVVALRKPTREEWEKLVEEMTGKSPG